MNENQRENINKAKNLPAGLMSQHLYPRLAVGDPGPDGEMTIRLILGLPCCGVDLELECPPGMTVEELGVVERAFFELRQTIAALPTFSVCQVPAQSGSLDDSTMASLRMDVLQERAAVQDEQDAGKEWAALRSL